jgi:hypothetical protein
MTAMYRVARTESVEYRRDFTEAELIELGVPPETFEGDLDMNFTWVEAIEDTKVVEALIDATEAHSRSVDNQWSIRKIVED